MTEKLKHSPEDEPLTAVFGDVVTCINSPRFEHVVVAAHDDGWCDAIAIVDEENNRYGMPGSIAPGHLTAIVGRKSYNEVIEIAAKTFGQGELTQQWLDFARQHYPE